MKEMDDLIKFILNKDFMLSLLTTMFTVVYATFMLYFLRMRRNRREQKKMKFYRTLLEGLKANVINSIDDLINIYKGITNLTSEDLTYRYGLNKWLREFLVVLISKELDKSLSDENIILWKNSISEFIKINEHTSPYSDLPDAERNILNDISIFLDTPNIDAIKRKLLELSEIIQARKEDLNKMYSMNKWSVPLAVIGLILTVIFGIISLIK